MDQIYLNFKNTVLLKTVFFSLLLSPVWFCSVSASVMTQDNSVLPVALHNNDMKVVQNDADRKGVMLLALKSEPATKVSEAQARKIGLKSVPGKVTGVKIEKKYGKQVYAVEIMEKDGKETDVFVDVNTGEVLGTD